MIGLPLLMVTVLLAAAAGLTAVACLLLGRYDIMARVVKVSVVGVAAYFSLLLGVSTGSKATVLEPGARKAFCGAYIDCHIGVTVVDSWRSTELISDDQSWSASGEFVFVDVEFSSDAMNYQFHLRNPEFTLVAVNGGRFERARHLEYEVASRLGQAQSLSTQLGPGESTRMTLVFEIPKDTSDLRLHATLGELGERFVELFLIGDEDSLLHRPVLLRLDETANGVI
jgi:hypothetical protein